MAIIPLKIVKKLSEDSPSTDMHNIICNHLDQYSGASPCKASLAAICEKNNLNHLIKAADQCQLWFFPNTAPVYQCNSYNLLTTDTSLPQTASTVVGSFSSSGFNPVYSVGSSSATVVGTVSLNEQYVPIYYAGNAIVQYAPTNNADLYDALQACGNWNNTDSGIYNHNKCSDVAGISNNDYQACVGALLSVSPAWLYEVG